LLFTIVVTWFCVFLLFAMRMLPISVSRTKSLFSFEIC